MIIQAKSAVINGKIENDQTIHIKNGLISKIVSGTSKSADITFADLLIPAFVDIHCHGGAGSYFASESEDEITKVINFHKSHGTHTVIASLVSAEVHDLKQQIRRLLPFFESGAIAGIHLEGPYISHARCGSHDPLALREPSIEVLDEMISLGGGAIKMVTIAPELRSAMDSIELMAAKGVIVAIGHSNGRYEEASAALDAGATVATHFSNAMAKLPDGDRTFATALLEDPQVTLEIIADSQHVDDKTINRVREIAPGRIALITDAMSAAGCEDGAYKIGNLDVKVKNGIARLMSNGSLAGSTLTMDKAFLNFIDVGATVVEASLAASTTPARALALKDVGEIKVGMKPNFLTYNPQTFTLETPILPA